MSLRVNCFGSVFYRIASALRAHTDLDVHVFIDERTLALDTALRDEAAIGTSDWIHRLPLLDARSLAAPWRSEATRRLAEGDVVLTSELGPVFAQFTGRPVGFLPVGGDLTVTPFPIRSRFLRSSRRDQLTAAGIAAWQRRGIRRSDRIWAQPFQPFVDALARLGIADRRDPRYLPIPVDSDLFADIGDRRAGAASAFPQVADAGDFVVFHPSRLMIEARPFLRQTGQWKRNEVVLQAFARLCARSTGSPVLVLVAQHHSPDLARAEELIEQLGIGDHVLWVRASGAAGFSWRQMRDLYLLADVVLDDFGAGWFGMVVLEGASSSRPVITHVDEVVMGQLYASNPLIEANDPEAVAEQLHVLERDPAARAELGAAGRAWIEANHAPPAIAARYAAAIADLATVRR